MKKINLSLYTFLAVALAIADILIPVPASYAQGNLLLTPKRIVFEGSKNSVSVNLANSGKDTAHYVISIVNMRMTENGGFEEVPKEETLASSAEPYLRFFPRQVTLAPNEAQVIRVQFNNNGPQMKEGEYRSHLYVRALSRPTPLGEKANDESSAIEVKLVPVFGISIPVIIRIGENNTSAAITGLSLTQTAAEPAPILHLILNRTGNMSLYGDISVKHIMPNGLATPVGSVKGLAVYTPNLLRNIEIVLRDNKLVNYHVGKLVVLFTENGGSKDQKLAEAELALK